MSVRIAHVVTLNSADGAFGGPVSVMRQQTRELARRGHEVSVYCGWDGHAVLDRLDRLQTLGFPTRRVVPGLQFAGLSSPGLLAELRRNAAKYDVVHVHLARDLVTMPAALISTRRTATVVQTHGMIVPDGRAAAKVFDAALTRRVLGAARAVLSLTPAEDKAISELTRNQVAPIRLGNGIAIGDGQHRRNGRKVVFCARLHPRKRVLAFVDMAEQLVRSGVDAEFVIAGPDEGDLPALQARLATLGKTVDISYLGAVAPDDAQTLLATARVFVLPSVDEPFPMTVLEALALGTPAVITESCGIADDLRRSGGAVVTDGTASALAAAVADVLADDATWQAQSEAGQKAIRDSFSLDSVIDRLEEIYARRQ